MSDDLERHVREAFLRTHAALGEGHADLVALATTVQALVDVLVARGVVGAAELEAQLEVAARRVADSRLGQRSLVRGEELLRDKYQEPNAPVDCEARMPLCKGACCACRVPLGAQDLRENVLRWDLAHPYFLRKTAAGRCTHQDTTTGACTVYEQRPLACRSYTCKDDRRIWKDFDARVPNEKGIAALFHGRAERPIAIRPRSAVPHPLRRNDD